MSNGAKIGNAPPIMVRIPSEADTGGWTRPDMMLQAMRERLAAIPTLYRSPAACSERLDELANAIELCQRIAVTALRDERKDPMAAGA